MAFETTFGIEISDDDADPMQRVRYAIAYVEAQVALGRTRRPVGQATDPIDGERTFVSAPGDHDEGAGRSFTMGRIAKAASRKCSTSLERRFVLPLEVLPGLRLGHGRGFVWPRDRGLTT